MIILTKENETKKVFEKISDYNRYVLTVSNTLSKNKIEKTNLFNLLTEFGYTTVKHMMEMGFLPKLDTLPFGEDEYVLWSDEKAKSINLFSFKDDEEKTWYFSGVNKDIIEPKEENDKKYYINHHYLFNKLEKLMSDNGFITLVTH